MELGAVGMPLFGHAVDAALRGIRNEVAQYGRHIMKLLKLVVIAGTALTLSGPALAGRDQSQIIEQERAAQKMRSEQGLKGPTGPQGQVGPATQGGGRICKNFGHPSERVRC